jgi:hypothetical protein
MGYTHANLICFHGHFLLLLLAAGSMALLSVVVWMENALLR